jgi:hypothetical protein
MKTKKAIFLALIIASVFYSQSLCATSPKVLHGGILPDWLTKIFTPEAPREINGTCNLDINISTAQYTQLKSKLTDYITNQTSCTDLTFGKKTSEDRVTGIIMTCKGYDFATIHSIKIPGTKIVSENEQVLVEKSPFPDDISHQMDYMKDIFIPAIQAILENSFVFADNPNFLQKADIFDGKLGHKNTLAVTIIYTGQKIETRKLTINSNPETTISDIEEEIGRQLPNSRMLTWYSNGNSQITVYYQPFE